MNTSGESQLNGAISLLRDCVRGKVGERVLIVREPEGSNYYDNNAPRIAADAGRELGLTVYETVSDSFITDQNQKAKLLDTLSGFDHIIFFSRVGDQIRFACDENIPSSTMCYALNVEALNSNFGKACHQGMTEVKKAIDSAFEKAPQVRVTCPLGTDYSGRPDWSDVTQVEVSLKRFPLLVPQPIPATGLSGKVVLSRFLTGTGSRQYEPYTLNLPKKLFAHFKNNRITHFEGNDEDVERVENHYKTVSEQFDIDPWHIDSWHSGIHPGCQFEANAMEDIVRWSGSAFGNPRVLHFHTCGEYAPGEICWHVLDPTISIDGVNVWEKGKLFPQRIEGVDEIFARHSNLAELYENPTTLIGMDN